VNGKRWVLPTLRGPGRKTGAFCFSVSPISLSAMQTDPNHRIFGMSWAAIHAAYLAKITRKGRDPADLDRILRWLTGRDRLAMDEVLQHGTVRDFFDTAPAMNPARAGVTGTICGVRIEEIDHPLMKDIRILDKLVDELAKGRAMDKILRA
jgi:hypothetical protein